MLWAAIHIASHTFLESNLSTKFRASYKVLKSCRQQRRGKRYGVRGRRNRQNTSVSSVIYLHVQAQYHCDQSDQTDKMQVIKLLWHPVI